MDRPRRLWPFAVLAVLLVFPLVVHEGTYLDLVFFTLMYAAMSVGWDIMGGYTG